MQDQREPLREALNLRIGDKLSSEIDRIAGRIGRTASETARMLLSYGVEVERRLEAQRLMQHHEEEYDDEIAGRIVISAEFVPYTWQEAGEIQARVEEMVNRSGPTPPKYPRWLDIEP